MDVVFQYVLGIYLWGSHPRALTHEEAEDVVQETMLAVSKNIRDFKYDPKKGKFRGWLFTQVRWKIADQFRKRQKNPVMK